jgi:hypothetical protein
MNPLNATLLPCCNLPCFWKQKADVPTSFRVQGVSSRGMHQLLPQSRGVPGDVGCRVLLAHLVDQGWQGADRLVPNNQFVEHRNTPEAIAASNCGVVVGPHNVIESYCEPTMNLQRSGPRPLCCEPRKWVGHAPMSTLTVQFCSKCIVCAKLHTGFQGCHQVHVCVLVCILSALEIQAQCRLSRLDGRCLAISTSRSLFVH